MKKQEMTWEPIETAPSDEFVLISGFIRDNKAEGRWVLCAFNPSGFDGWYTEEDTDESLYPPTHWMRMPAPPEDTP